MAMEALQQMILQRPQLIGYGIGAARDEGRERRLFEMQRSGNLVEGILQAIGLALEQQRFGQQMEEGQRQFNVTEGIPGEGGIPQPEGFRARAEQRAQQSFESDPMRDPAYQRGLIEQLLTGVQQQKDEAGFYRATRPQAFAGLNQDLEAGKLGLERGRFGFGQEQEMAPLQRQAAEQGLERGGLEMRGEEQRQEGVARQQDWLKRFQAAPDEATRYELIGQDPDSWLQLQLGSMRMEGDLAKAGTPQDFALEELRKRQGTFEKIATTGTEGFATLTESAAEKARGMEAAFQGLMQQIMSGQIQPLPGESREAFLGRVLSTLGQGAAPGVGAPASQVPNEDFSVPPR